MVGTNIADFFMITSVKVLIDFWFSEFHKEQWTGKKGINFMNEQIYEQEINLGKTIYRMFRDWRKIFVAALAVAVLVGVGYFVLEKIKTSDPDYVKTAEENYAREMAAFEAKGETLQREIANLEETRAEREAYNADSILMKINPYREFNASLQLYVATDYQIVPELTYQNIDLSNRILRSYLTYMVNGDMYQYIMEHMSRPVELRYLKEILSVSGDYDNRMVTIAVRGENGEDCREIIQCALEGILEKQEGITSAIGEHELNAVNQSVYETVNLELDEWQKNNLQYVSELSIRLQEKAEEYMEWEASPKPGRDYTMTAVVRGSVKGMVIAFLAGAVLAAAFIAFRYIMSDKLEDAGELKNRFGIRVIAQIPKVHKKRVWVGFDRLFARMGGLTLYERDALTLKRVAAQSVKAELAALENSVIDDGIAKKPEFCGTKGKDSASGSPASKKVRVVFTGHATPEEIESFLSAAEWEKSYGIKCVPNILNDPSAVSAIMDADYVVLVEKQGGSTCAEIERELEALFAWKKKVLGFIVTDVDAVP